jgi:hypothetical protein
MPPPSPPTPAHPGSTGFARISNFAEEKTQAIIRKTKLFLLVEIRTAIQRDS